MIFDNLLRDFGPRSLSHERGGRCAVKPRGPRGVCSTKSIRSGVMVARGLRNPPASMTIASLTGRNAAEIIPHRPIRMQPKPSELRKCRWESRQRPDDSREVLVLRDLERVPFDKTAPRVCKRRSRKGHPRFLGASKWVAPSAPTLSDDSWAG